MGTVLPVSRSCRRRADLRFRLRAIRKISLIRLQISRGKALKDQFQRLPSINLVGKGLWHIGQKASAPEYGATKADIDSNPLQRSLV
jgi:hypothetical protein